MSAYTTKEPPEKVVAAGLPVVVVKLSARSCRATKKNSWSKSIRYFLYTWSYVVDSWITTLIKDQFGIYSTTTTVATGYFQF